MMKLGVRAKAEYVSACESSSFFVRVAVLELLCLSLPVFELPFSSQVAV